MAFSESTSKKIPWHLLKVPAILISGISGSALKYNQRQFPKNAGKDLPRLEQIQHFFFCLEKLLPALLVQLPALLGASNLGT
jgi:hypothetical protein